MRGHIEAVLFDLDGTLVDSYSLLASSWCRAMNRLVNSRCLEEATSIFLHEAGTERHLLLKHGGDEADVQTFFRIYDDNIVALELYDGVQDVLTDLQGGGWKLGLVTGRCRETALSTITALGVLHMFETVVTGDDVKCQKPDPEPILTACRNLNISPSAALYVSDEISDLQAGLSVGALPAMAAWGNRSVPSIPFKPQLHSPAELLTLLRGS